MTADAIAVILHASAEETASGTGTAIDLQSDDVTLRRAARLDLNISAITGTLGLSLQTSRDGLSWLNASDGSYAAVGASELWVGECMRYLRVSWTLGVGQSATFELTGEVRQTFCTLVQLVAIGAAEDILLSVTDGERLRHIESASSYARGYLAKVGQTPILGVGSDVAAAVAKIAVEECVTSDAGIHPTEGVTELLVAAADRARQWLRDVAAGKAVADVTYSDPADVVPDPNEGTSGGSGVVYGDAVRGWSDAMP